jgi:hypothetical protein
VVPTFGEWFWGSDPKAAEPNGRFWLEWVVSRKNKPGEMEQKKSIYLTHLAVPFGKVALDQIGPAEIARFRASLIERSPLLGGKDRGQGRKAVTGRKLSDKTVNNVLAVLSKPLRYAAEVQVIARSPKVGLFKVERPEFVC